MCEDCKKEYDNPLSRRFHAETNCCNKCGPKLLLTDNKGNFNVGYGYLILNQNKKELLGQIEAEFRAQIEKVISQTKVDHLDSHVHTHAIPEIFKLTCKLAKDYRTTIRCVYA